MPSNHLILCRPFLLLPSIWPGIKPGPLALGVQSLATRPFGKSPCALVSLKDVSGPKANKVLEWSGLARSRPSVTGSSRKSSSIGSTAAWVDQKTWSLPKSPAADLQTKYWTKNDFSSATCLGGHCILLKYLTDTWCQREGMIFFFLINHSCSTLVSLSRKLETNLLWHQHGICVPYYIKY